MSVGHILTLAGNKIGLNPQDEDQRNVLLRYLNEAAMELYEQSDMPGSLMEQVFKVNGDQTISLPHYVGDVRACREFCSQQPWHINQMRPRYNTYNWKDMWRNYRLRNKQALMATVTNQSVGVISVPIVENPPIVVTLTGPTVNATSISESITMTSTIMNSVNNFLDYTAVKKNAVNTVDVTLTDVDGKVLTIIPNTEFESIYQIIDVSSCPWLPQDTSPLDNYMEILYKKKLLHLSNDADEFPAFECDTIVVNKILQLFFEEQKQADVAQAYDAKATRSLARKTENANRSTEDMVALTNNPHDSILPKIRSMRRRWGLWSGRRW